MAADDWKISHAELRADTRSLSADLDDLSERVDSMQQQLAGIPVLLSRQEALEDTLGEVRTGQANDSRQVDRLFTGLKVAGAIATVAFALAMVLTPALIRSSIRDAVQENTMLLKAKTP